MFYKQKTTYKNLDEPTKIQIDSLHNLKALQKKKHKVSLYVHNHTHYKPLSLDDKFDISD